MKICPVCDKKVTGTFCFNCRQFITPVEVSDGMHLNESHDLAHDADCDYHRMMPETPEEIANPVDSMQTPSMEKDLSHVGGEIYPTITEDPVVVKSNIRKNYGVILAAVIMIMVAAILVLVNGALRFGNKSGVSNRSEQETPFDIQSILENQGTGYYSSLSDLDLDNYAEVLPEDYSYLREIEPESIEYDQNVAVPYVYYYYDPEDIQAAGVPCNGEYHMAHDVDLVESWLMEDYGKDSVLSEEDCSSENHYYYEDDDYYGYTVYETYRYYDVAGLEDGYFVITYDTVNREVLFVAYYAYELTDENTLAATEFFRHFIPDITVEDVETLEEHLLDGDEDVANFDLSDDYGIDMYDQTYGYVYYLAPVRELGTGSME